MLLRLPIAIGLAVRLLTAFLVLAAALPQARAQGEPAQFEKALEGATKVGDGVVTAYSKGDKTLLVLPKFAFERLFLWYAEFVAVPSGIASQLPLGGATVKFERHHDRVFIRDLTATFAARVETRQDPRPGQLAGHDLNPIALSVRRANEPPVVGILPVVAVAPDGRVALDITRHFSDDIEIMSARPLVLSTGLMPVAVNPLASYITSVRVFPENFNIRAHLTFLAKDTKSAELPPRGVSLRVGHSFVMLPDQPMPARRYDPRVGYFYAGASTADPNKFIEFETADGAVQRSAAVIMRFRLEKKNPGQAVSDPVAPIVFYIGREVPDRWRPFLKAGVEMWKPAFEAAGFSNAIIARDAPSVAEYPDWTPEDARFSTIRWLAQPRENARGPHTVDPRSGEVISSHVEVWPQVLGLFSRYYYALMSPLDPRAKTLPLSEDVQGEILKYVVGHEVGHAIGLRHNHIASTAYSIAQMRDPAFANRWGANASIMAYGRFNQAAQPGDGITRYLPTLGPYDFFAINWGYGRHGTSPKDEQSALEVLAAGAQADRQLMWGAGELPEEIADWATDPRVLKENTGAERVEATRLGVANILRSLQSLDAATAGDTQEFNAALGQFVWAHSGLLKSVPKLVAGVEASPHARTGRVTLVPASRQKDAVIYYLEDGALTLDAYRVPSISRRAAMVGTDRMVDTLQSALVRELFDDTRLAMLETQKAADPNAYGLIEFAQDTYSALWADLASAPPGRRALQRAYLQRMADILKGEAADPKIREAATAALRKQGLPETFIAAGIASASDTIYPAWIRDTLPRLATRLDAAAKKVRSKEDKLHFEAMATLARRIAPGGR